MNRTEQWIASISGGLSRVQVAKAAGIPQPTLTRQVQGDSLTVENAVKLARAFAVSVPDALVWHGVATSEELSSVSLVGTLADATDQQLLDEIARRLALVDEGESEVFDSVPDAGATIHYPEFTREPVEDERAVASPISDDDGYDTNYDD